MKHLFTPEGDASMAATMARRPLLAFDFDGTLAPIVARPDDARVPLAVARRLDHLARQLPLAIISGRSVDDVRGRLAFEPRHIIGNHGAESPFAEPQDADGAIFDPIRAVLQSHADLLVAAGVAVEDKQHSLALHYRLARDRGQALDLIQQLVSASGPGIRVFGGKMVVNVVAARAPDKGAAVVDLLAHCGVSSAVFAGDDVNDEPVFERAAPHWLTVRVGREDPNSRAMYCLDSFGEVATMLDRMITLLGLPGPA